MVSRFSKQPRDLVFIPPDSVENFALNLEAHRLIVSSSRDNVNVDGASHV
jgi:hypothetical protein